MQASPGQRGLSMAVRSPDPSLLPSAGDGAGCIPPPAPDWLARVRRSDLKIFSQNGEDGILLNIFRNIGATNRWFVEVRCCMHAG